MLASLLPTLLLTFSEPTAEAPAPPPPAPAPAAAPASTASVNDSRHYVAPKGRDLGGYVGLRARPATLGRQYGSFIGFGGGLIFKRKFSLGLEVNAMSPEGPHQFRKPLAPSQAGSHRDQRRIRGDAQRRPVRRLGIVPGQLVALVYGDDTFRIQAQAQQPHTQQVLPHAFGNADDPVQARVQKSEPRQG